MRSIYLFMLLYIFSFPRSQVVRIYENSKFDGISKSFSALDEVKKVLNQRDKTFDNKKFKLVISY